MVTNIKGIQLFLKMGQPKSKPKLVPYEIMTALNTVEVNDDVHEQQDGFQMTFTLGKHQVKDYTLLGSGLFNIDTKVVIGVLLNATPYVLISGVITQFQLQASNQPGMSTLSIDGQSITHRLRRTELNDKHERLSDTQIVEKLIGRYAGDGLTVDAPKTTEQPLDTYLIPHQAATDMEFIQELARRNGYVFYTLPDKDGNCVAYWGPENRKRVLLPALTMNMGAATNVSELSFTQNSHSPTKVKGSFQDPQSKRRTEVSPEAQENTVVPLAQTSTPELNTVLLRDTAKYTSSRSARTARTATMPGLGSVSGQGTLHTVRYGHILEAGKVVEVRGSGFLYDGRYIVNHVKHSLERGKYTQSFTLEREGVGAQEQKVRQI